MPTVPQTPAPPAALTGRAAELAAQMELVARHATATAVALVAAGGLAAAWAGPLAGVVAAAAATVVYGIGACLRHSARLLVAGLADRN